MKWVEHGDGDWHGYIPGESSRRYRVVKNLGGDFVAWLRDRSSRKEAWKQITGLVTLEQAFAACSDHLVGTLPHA